MSSLNDREAKVASIIGTVVLIVFGIALGGIGLVVIISVWSSAPGFGDPPTFFKIFASLIALPFIAIGILFLAGALGLAKFGRKSSAAALAQQLKDTPLESPQPSAESTVSPLNYTCPHCGAPLDSSSSASPHGDVKCTHCETWFNIHGK